MPSTFPEDNAELQQAILNHVQQPNYQPVKPKVIAKKLGVEKERHPEVKRAVKQLVKKGKLAYGAKHLVQPAQPSKVDSGRITGVLRKVMSGDGFVRPQMATPGDRSEDVYIPAADCADASTGDTVLVRVTRPSGPRPNRRGIIVEVLERETHTFVGTYFEKEEYGYVQVDGTVFSEPVYVGDAGAKNAQSGEKVVFEMVRFPTHIHGGEGVITEVLGPRGKPGVDTLGVIREFNLPEAFAEETLAEARRVAEQFDESLKGRTDFTSETVITIDPEDARDFDDAISLVPLERGHWKLGVHIADVAHFVPVGSALDREARERATSVYLPDRVLPMLPEIVSNSLASLQPDHVRYTKTVMMEFNADGVLVDTQWYRAAIRSCRRFTYEEVDSYLASPKAWKTKLTPEVFKLLGDMHRLAMQLRARRMKRGSLELTLPDVHVKLDPDGNVCGAYQEENTESHQIIEEFMLAANEAVASRLSRQGIRFLHRVHPPPTERKTKTLTSFVRELGISVENLKNRFALQQLLHDVEGSPQERAVHFAVLRSMGQAVYTPEELGHFALASEYYCHFTSPIRRYPDLTVHRLLDALIEERKPPDQNIPKLAVLGQHCSDRERRAEAAERELNKIKLLSYFSQRLGLEMDAVVSGVESFGLFAMGLEIPAEGMLHITSLPDDLYEYDKHTHTLSGRRSNNTFRLGDTIRVVVAHVDVQRRELDFRLVAKKSRTRPASKSGPARTSTKKRKTAKKKGPTAGPKTTRKKRRK